MEQKNQVKCPVCGKVTTEAKKRSYEELLRKVENLTKSLEYRDMEKHADDELLEKKRKTIVDLRKTISDQWKQIETLQKQLLDVRTQLEKFADDNVELRVENARLVNRSFWERVLNK